MRKRPRYIRIGIALYEEYDPQQKLHRGNERARCYQKVSRMTVSGGMGASQRIVMQGRTVSSGLSDKVLQTTVNSRPLGG